jgi:hypothetical protein
VTLYYRARYYDSQMGRFVREDPAGWPAGVNFYIYVNNSPLNLVDPTGFCAWQVHSRPLSGIPGSGPANLDHYYFYNTQTGRSIGLGPAKPTTTGPVPGAWETNERAGTKEIDVPDWLCDCVDHKVKNPGSPPDYCTFKGKSPKPAQTCMNCLGWATKVLQDCYNQEYPNRH